MPRHCLRISDFSAAEIKKILSLSAKLKKELKTKGKNKEVFKNKTLAMIFEKPSLRTRISFEIGMTQLGGHAIYLGPSDIQMGTRETPQDVGIVTSSMADMIMARTFKHQSVVDLAEGSSVPVINGLSDLEHPCQVLADFQTIQEKFGKTSGLKIVFLGDGDNNVTHSLALISTLLGNHFVCSSPKGYKMKPEVFQQAQEYAKKSKGKIEQVEDPVAAVTDADVIIADTWVSMGDEKEKEQRLRVFPPYQVTAALMKKAKKKAIFMHCLPAYRGKEVSAEVIDGPQSVVFQEAENRLHAQKGLLVYLMSK
jgi:ornithine carbamoyltransferase